MISLFILSVVSLYIDPPPYKATVAPIYNIYCEREGEGTTVGIRYAMMGYWAIEPVTLQDGRLVYISIIVKQGWYGFFVENNWFGYYADIDFKIGDDKVNYMKLDLIGDANNELLHIKDWEFGESGQETFDGAHYWCKSTDIEFYQ